MEALDFDRVIKLWYNESMIVKSQYDENAKQVLVRYEEGVHYHIFQLEKELDYWKKQLSETKISVFAYTKEKRHEGHSFRIVENLFVQFQEEYYVFEFFNDANENLILMTPKCFELTENCFEEKEKHIPEYLVTLIKEERTNFVKNARYKEKYQTGEKQIQIGY